MRKNAPRVGSIPELVFMLLIQKSSIWMLMSD